MKFFAVAALLATTSAIKLESKNETHDNTEHENLQQDAEVRSFIQTLDTITDRFAERQS